MSSDSMDQPRNPCEVGGALGVCGVGVEWEFVEGNGGLNKVWGVQFKQRLIVWNFAGFVNAWFEKRIS